MISNVSDKHATVGRRRKEKKCNIRVVTYFDEDIGKKLEAYGNLLGIVNHGGVVKSIVHLFLSKNPNIQLTF
jgi:hypothetical protein